MTMTQAEPAAGPGSTLSPARKAMIDSQLRTSGVNEPWVLAAMAAVPRENYVPEANRASAYIDRAVPLGDGRFLAAPLVHGKILAEAEPRPTDHVLVIGGGSEYLADLVRPLAASVETISAADAANFTGLGPYSLVLIDGAIEELPAGIASALAEDGRIVGGLVERGITRLAVGRGVGGSVAWLRLAELGMPSLPELSAPRRWSF